MNILLTFAQIASIGGEIPDATTIHQIRKQRQLARDMGDFLPLDDTVKYENEKSRLIRYCITVVKLQEILTPKKKKEKKIW